jgi:hypothetical protein
VLMEFELDELRRPVAPRISRSDASARLEEGARQIIKSLQFDASDHSRRRPNLTYRVTVIFCLRPGHCDDLVPLTALKRFSSER